DCWSLFHHNRQIPRLERDRLIRSDSVICQDILAVLVRVWELLLLTRKVQIIMQDLALCIAPVPHLYRFGKALIGASQAGCLRDIAHYLALQRIGEIRTFIGQSAASIFVASDGRE